MLKLDRNKRQIKIDLPENNIIIKPVKFSTLGDFVSLFEELLQKQLEASFSVGKFLSDSNNLELLKSLCDLIPINGNKTLDLDDFEYRSDLLSELFFGIPKTKGLTLSEAYWRHINPSNKKIIDFFEKHGDIRDDEIFKELFRQNQASNLSDSFDPPWICILNELNWFTTIVEQVKKIENAKAVEAVSIEST